MLKKTYCRISSAQHYAIVVSVALCFVLHYTEVTSCSPGRTGSRRRSARKLTPLVFKQHIPNVAEHSLGASGLPEGRIFRDDDRFKNLVPNYNSDIVFKDEEGTGVDRLMSRRCKEKLDILAISVMNMWPGVRLRVTEGFDEEGHHPKNSLHYEGRAVAISTSDRDLSKYGMLARLAVDAGFDWVYYEARTHIYCSVKIEPITSSRFSGCFHGSSEVITRHGVKPIDGLVIGEDILSSERNGYLYYSKLIGFLHRDPNLRNMFIQLITETNNTLHVTKEHLVVNEAREIIHAADISHGDKVWILRDKATLEISTVISVKYTNLTGVYAPITEAGTIIVDGVECSCYAMIQSHNLAHFAFGPLRIMYRLRSYLLQLLPGLNGLISGKSFVCDMNDTLKYQNSGELHWYVSFLCDLSEIFMKICK